MKAFVFALLGLFIGANEAKIFTKCELAQLLKKHGMDGFCGYSLGDWVCMAHASSCYSTNKVNGLHYGIFQISGSLWCYNGVDHSSNGCRTCCKNFLDDDIEDDIKCAKLIIKTHRKMDAWKYWNTYCYGKDLTKWLEDC